MKITPRLTGVNAVALLRETEQRRHRTKAAPRERPAWQAPTWPASLRRQSPIPLLTGEKLEMLRGFKPFIDNQTVDILHADLNDWQPDRDLFS